MTPLTTLERTMDPTLHRIAGLFANATTAGKQNLYFGGTTKLLYSSSVCQTCSIVSQVDLFDRLTRYFSGYEALPASALRNSSCKYAVAALRPHALSSDWLNDAGN
mmetsp:Transcript_11297/g.19946  ORF Transcript_11297/g.19946 Transcript_11297/m.19946 type:complete len:106 (-) Transcript_11297:20-337(-)